jgi:plasmid maintenance system antidote protein VapI
MVRCCDPDDRTWITQARLAKLAGIAQSTISAVLNGHRTLTKEQVLTLAKIFHVSANAFLRVEGLSGCRADVL